MQREASCTELVNESDNQIEPNQSHMHGSRRRINPQVESEERQEARHLHLPVWTRSWHLTFDCFRASIKVPLSDGPCCKITSELKVDPWWGLELSSETAPTGAYIPDRNVVDLSGGGRNGCAGAPTDTAPSAGPQGANICPFEPTGWSELDRRIDTYLSHPDSRWDGG